MNELELTRREKAWMKRLQVLVDSRPPGIWVFLNGEGTATLNVMRLGADGEPVLTGLGGGVDQDYVLGTVGAPFWDGGGW